MTNLEVPEMVQKSIDKFGWGTDFEYTEVVINGVTMRTARRFVPEKDTYEHMIFPAFGEFAPKIRFDWELSGQVVREEGGNDFEKHMNKLIYYQLMQDLFEILEVVADKSESKDIYRPVIPESVWAD